MGINKYWQTQALILGLPTVSMTYAFTRLYVPLWLRGTKRQGDFPSQVAHNMMVGMSVWSLFCWGDDYEHMQDSCASSPLILTKFYYFVQILFCLNFWTVSPSRPFRVHTETLYHCGLAKIISCTNHSASRIIYVVHTKWKE